MNTMHEPAPRELKQPDCTYNVFRNKRWPELLCAVPEDRPVPSFISPEKWLFDRSLKPAEVRPGGFSEGAASNGAQMNGFYLFHSVAANENRAAPATLLHS